MKEKIFNVIKELKKRKMTVHDMSSKLGIDRNTANRQINGNPTVNTLKKFADAIGCEVKDFFNKDDNQ